MATTPVNALTDVGAIADADKLVGERVDGTTVRITFNGVLYDADFTTNGLMTRTAAGTYADRTLTGTASRLSITNGDGVSGNPIFDIDSSYAGQNTITTLGTISTGVWNATLLDVAYGGTGRATATAYAPLLGGITATGAHQSAAAGTSGQLFQSGGASAVPAWTTATYPTTAGASGKVLQSDGTNYVETTVTYPSTTGGNGKILRSNGTNFIETTTTYPSVTTVNQILYSSIANGVAGLATANSGVLVTSGAGVPSIATDIPTAVTIGGQYAYRAGGTDVPVTDGGTGVSVAGITAFNNITGYTAAGATGTTSTNLVFSTSPTLVTPALGTPTSGVLTNTTGGGGLRSYQIFTSGTGATYTKPANVTQIRVEIVGGGGGGGGSLGGAAGTLSVGGAGGAGGFTTKLITAPSATYTYTVGAGGAGGTAGTNNGSAGSTTTFSASSMQATGGAGGTGSLSTATTTSSLSGIGGVGTNGDINLSGDAGVTSAVLNGASGAGIVGKSGGSRWGSGVITVSLGTGVAGANYGSGGAGGLSTTVSAAGGAGSAGFIIVYEYS